jgi:acetyl-CoA synthetase
MPMIPETAVAMLACTRIGAIHSVVFGGFSPESIASRVDDCKSTLVITTDEGLRGGKRVPLKANTDAALEKTAAKPKVVVLRHTGGTVNMQAGRDLWDHDLAKNASADCPPLEMSAEDPLFILYTSGSTGKPKGVLHTTGGYRPPHPLWPIFDYHDGDTGAPPTSAGDRPQLSSTDRRQRRDDADVRGRRATDTLLLAGDRQHKVNIFYTAPAPSAPHGRWRRL